MQDSLFRKLVGVVLDPTVATVEYYAIERRDKMFPSMNPSIELFQRCLIVIMVFG